MTVIEVRATNEARKKYKELLRADWKKGTLDDVLALLWSIAQSANVSSYPWHKALEVSSTAKSGKELNPDIVARIRELSLLFAEPALPAMPTEFTDRKTRIVASAESTWAYLVLQSMASLTGDVGFFADLQSLLFLCSIQNLLFQLRHGHPSEHDCLINAMYVHTLLVWRNQPSHLFYLQGLIMDYLGERNKRLNLLDLSLRLTPIEDHSYLTKATAYWSDLMDLGKKREALDFLLSLNRYSPPAYQQEIGEMITETISGAPNIAV